MKLAPIAHNIILQSLVNSLTESATGTASAVQKQLFSLGAELKKDGENITDDEVQAAMLSALIDADGNINNVDASDIESIKTEIKEARSYVISESGILHSIEAAGTVLGNAALMHALAEALHKIGFNINEKKLKANLDFAISQIKSITGFPAKAMEKAFEWIAKKLGAGVLGQKIAGIAGTIIVTVCLLALAIYLFPSINSVILMIFAISGMMGKSVEIATLIKKLIAHITEYAEENPEFSKNLSALSVTSARA